MPFTVTLSTAVCKACPGTDEKGSPPAVGQMSALQAAILNPASVGYKPRNSPAYLSEAYHKRWMHSFNTAMEWISKTIYKRWPRYRKILAIHCVDLYSSNS